jgi:1,4-dihydroxy-2-naphthoyl-CoA hydrolase
MFIVNFCLKKECAMGIWFNKADVADMNMRGKNTMGDFLGINFTQAGDDYLCATMPVNERTRQPLGIMHGGSSCVLAETVGSTAANYCVDINKNYCVGLDINTNHIRSIREGTVTATAKPFHIGKTTQVWSIEIRDEQEKLISVTRLTMAVLSR